MKTLNVSKYLWLFYFYSILVAQYQERKMMVGASGICGRLNMVLMMTESTRGRG